MFVFKTILWILAYSLGMARLSLTFIIFKKEKRKVELWNSAFQLVFALLILSLGNIEIPGYMGQGYLKVFATLSTYFTALLVMTLPVYMHYRIDLGEKMVWRNRFFIALSLILCLFITTDWTGWIHYPPKLILRITLLVMSLSIIYANVLRGIDNRKRGYKGKSLKLMVYSVISLVPVMFVVDFYYHSMRAYIITPIIYILVNLFMYTADHESVLNKRNDQDIFDNNVKTFKLTKRESEVASLLVQGKTYQEIGDDLFISIQTVKTHANRIYSKTESKNKIELGRMLSSSL